MALLKYSYCKNLQRNLMNFAGLRFPIYFRYGDYLDDCNHILLFYS